MNKKTLIFFGAGSTASLGLPTTAIQDSIFKDLVMSDKPIKERLKGKGLSDSLIEDLEETLTLLLDGNGSLSNQEAEIKRKEAEKKFRKRIKDIIGLPESNISRYLEVSFYSQYDWLAFKSIARAIYNNAEEKKITIQDVLTVITNSFLNRISLPTREIFEEDINRNKIKVYVNYPERLSGALKVYKLILYKIFKHKVKEIRKHRKRIKMYEEFCKSLVEEFISFPENLENITLNSVSSLSLATLNWDPIFPILFMKACKEKNDELISKKRRIYLGYGAPFLVVKLSGRDKGLYIFDEDSVTLVNAMALEEKEVCSGRMQLYKFFVPHGLFNMRVCPKCQNIFIILPTDVGKIKYNHLYTIFSLDPIPQKEDLEELNRLEKFQGKRFFPSRIKCPICGTPTYFQDTFLQVQSIVKPEEPALIRKIYTDYAVSFSKAEHLIFIGYSFPIDDIPHLLTLMTMNIGEITKKKLSLIIYSSTKELREETWFTLEKARKILEKTIRNNPNNNPDKLNLETLNNILKISKKNNIRVSFLGFPDILDKVKTKELIKWSV